MKKASELKKITIKQGDKIINEVLIGVEKHIEERCEEEAHKGNNSYLINLKSVALDLKEKLLNECIKIANKFEDNEYYVVIFSKKEVFFTNLYIHINWDKNLFENYLKSKSENILYYTEINNFNKNKKMSEM